MLDSLQTFLALFLVFGPLVINLFQPRLLLPLPQQPFRRPMKARIGRRPIHVQQLRQHGLASLWRKLLLAVLPQTEEQGPAYDHVRFLVQTLEDGPGIRTQRNQAMDEIAPALSDQRCVSRAAKLSQAGSF